MPRTEPVNRADSFGIVGSVVDGRYRIQCVAGEGGFGVVYLALHLGFESPIAIKVLKLPPDWSPEKTRARSAAFQREGKLLFELSSFHPSILRAFETGTLALKDGSVVPYLALEWLDGVSLSYESSYRRQRELEPMSLHEVLTVLDGPATALGLAHDHGIVHRDIKPQNLFVSTGRAEPVVKILDFGIAKIVEESREASAASSAGTSVTAAFTPRYAAPEQWLQRLGGTGRATDVHAFALVCVELLTGHLPVRGQNSAELMAACLDPATRPTPKHYGLTLGARVDAVFARALALEPLERFADMRQFWSALCVAAEWAPGESKMHLESLEHAVSLRVQVERSVVSTWSGGLERISTAPTGQRSFARLLSVGLKRRPTRIFSALAALLALVVVLISPARPQTGDVALTLGVSRSASAPAERAESPTEERLAGTASVELPRARFDASEAASAADPARARSKVPRPAARAITLASAEELLRRGQLSDACARAEAILRGTPTFAQCLEFLGRCYMRLGQKERAFSYYRRYLGLAPEARDAVFIRAMVEPEQP